MRLDEFLMFTFEDHGLDRRVLRGWWGCSAILVRTEGISFNSVLDRMTKQEAEILWRQAGFGPANTESTAIMVGLINRIKQRMEDNNDGEQT